MTVWVRRGAPLAAAALAVVMALVLAPITDRAYAPAILPAVVFSTWIAGWRGGVVAFGAGFIGRVLWIQPHPWARPAWMALWMMLDVLAIVATEVARRARADRKEARRIAREQAGRAAKAMDTRRAEFLAHASEVLASSPDYQSTLAAVANLAVPHIADLCVVDILDDKGEFIPVAIAHVDPGKCDLVRELRQLYPLDPKAPFGPPRVLSGGRSIVYSEVPESAAEAGHIHPSEMRVALALGIRSTMAVPLLVGGRRLGVISLATTAESERRFVASDVTFAENLARRAALAIDTAHP
jgi:GAF domain-containing protein